MQAFAFLKTYASESSGIFWQKGLLERAVLKSQSLDDQVGKVGIPKDVIKNAGSSEKHFETSRIHMRNDKEQTASKLQINITNVSIFR